MKIPITPQGSRIMSKHGFIGTPSTKGITFHATYAKKGFSFELVRTKDGYKITPPIYTFRGVISHFAFVDDELRQYRNKQVIFKIVKALRESRIWNSICNKDFFTPNSFNTHMDSSKVKKEYLNYLKNG